MSSYKVHYFDFIGRAESVRWMLSYGKVEFEDIRYDYEGNWKEAKKCEKLF
jgi:hypothetical protein